MNFKKSNAFEFNYKCVKLRFCLTKLVSFLLYIKLNNKNSNNLKSNVYMNRDEAWHLNFSVKFVVKYKAYFLLNLSNELN